jgi:DNA end-binding protein Ku
VKGIEDEETEEPERGNVVDLMAALRKSLGDGSKPSATPSSTQAAAKPPAKAPKKRAAGASTQKPTRKRA